MICTNCNQPIREDQEELVREEAHAGPNDCIRSLARKVRELDERLVGVETVAREASAAMNGVTIP